MPPALLAVALASVVAASQTTPPSIVIAGRTKACFKVAGTPDEDALAMVMLLDGKDLGSFRLLEAPLGPAAGRGTWDRTAFSIEQVRQHILRNAKPAELLYGTPNDPAKASFVLLSILAADPAAPSLTVSPGPGVAHFDGSSR